MLHVGPLVLHETALESRIGPSIRKTQKTPILVFKRLMEYSAVPLGKKNEHHEERFGQ